MMRLRVLLAHAFLLTCPPPVIAIEVLEFDAGSIVVNLGHILSSGQFSLQGPRVTITNASSDPIVGLGWGFSACDGRPSFACAPGQVLQVGGVGGTEASITLDGVLQTHPAGFNAFSLQVTGAAVVPDFQNAPTSRLIGAFLLEGFLVPVGVGGFPSSPADGPGYLLHGQGIFDVALSQDPFGLNPPNATVAAWTWTRAEFDLQPVPEPTTLLLVGTTAVGLWLVGWRWRRSHESDHAA